MKKMVPLFFLVLGLNVGFVQAAQPEGFIAWKQLDFDESMQRAKFPDAINITKKITGYDGQAIYNFFKELYNNHTRALNQPQQSPKIPKIIHQIWLGGEVPAAFAPYMNSWITMHLERGWQYKLWTDDDVEAFGLYNKDFYDATDSCGVKSDLLKWEIIHRYGGVYVDMDFECLQPLDILHHCFDFYTGLQPLDTFFVQLGAALYAGKPGDPILKHCIETVKDDWHLKGAPSKTGPLHFTKSFYAVANKVDNYVAVAFPASYFYPLGAQEQVLKRSAWVQEGAVAVHHWAKSWMPEQFRKKEFRGLENDNTVKTWND